MGQNQRESNEIMITRRLVTFGLFALIAMIIILSMLPGNDRSMRNGETTGSLSQQTETPEESTVSSTNTPETLSVAVATSTLKGRAYDIDTKDGIAGVVVELNDRQTATGTDGYYSFTGLEEGRYQVSFLVPEGYVGQNQRLTSKPVYVAHGTETEGMDVSLWKGVSITGVVVDASGAPIPDADVFGDVVTNFYWNEQTKSDQQGVFELAGVMANCEVLIHAVKDKLVSGHHGPFTIGKDGLHGLEIELLEGGGVSGILVDEFREPLAYWPIVAWNRTGKGETETNSEGSFEITGLPSGNYELVAQPLSLAGRGAAGWLPLDRVEVAFGEMVEQLVLVYGDGLKISGRVADENGFPKHGLVVRAYEKGGAKHREFTTLTGADGTYQFVGLDEGDYSVTAVYPGGSNAYSGSVPAGSTDVDLVVKPFGSVEGQVIDAGTRQPIEEFEIHFQRGRIGELSTHHLTEEFDHVQDTEGHFYKNELPRGKKTIIVKAKGYATSFVVANVSPGETTTDVIVELERSNMLTGMVTDALGNPIPDAMVFYDSMPSDPTGHPRDEIIARSNMAGEFEVEYLPQGQDEITVFHPDYTWASVKFPDDEMNLQLPAVVLTRGGTLEGIVTLDGKPLPGVKVTVDATDAFYRYYRTNNEGTYHIEHVSLGTVLAFATLQPEGNPPQNRRSLVFVDAIEEDNTTKLDFNFVRTSSCIEGFILIDGQAPQQAGLKITVETAGGEESWDVGVKPNGWYREGRVPAGLVRLDAFALNADGIRYNQGVQFEIEHDKVVRQDFHLSSTH